MALKISFILMIQQPHYEASKTKKARVMNQIVYVRDPKTGHGFLDCEYFIGTTTLTYIF